MYNVNLNPGTQHSDLNHWASNIHSSKYILSYYIHTIVMTSNYNVCNSHTQYSSLAGDLATDNNTLSLSFTKFYNPRFLMTVASILNKMARVVLWAVLMVLVALFSMYYLDTPVPEEIPEKLKVRLIDASMRTYGHLVSTCRSKV